MKTVGKMIMCGSDVVGRMVVIIHGGVEFYWEFIIMFLFLFVMMSRLKILIIIDMIVIMIMLILKELIFKILFSINIINIWSWMFLFDS